MTSAVTSHVFPEKCRRCRNRDAVNGKRTCSYCLQVAAAGESKRQKEWRMARLCTLCGGERSTGVCYCESCATKTRNRANSLAKSRLIRGVCRRCGVEPFVSGSQMCQQCYLKSMAGKHLGSDKKWPILLDKLYRCDWKCFYSGESLVLGGNLSFDHMDPVKRFPERRTDPTNVVPCTWKINLYKRDLTKYEFLSLVHRIADWDLKKEY